MNNIAGAVRKIMGVPAKSEPAPRKIRFASPKQVKKASAWAIKRYAEVFRKLAE